MGRKGQYPNNGPRTSLVSNQEVRRALRGDSPPAFGIRRRLEYDCEEEILDVTFGMYREKDIPRKVVLRDRLSVTLLSQKVIGRQLARGVIAGYNLGRASAMVERSSGCSDRYEPLEVTRGDIRIFQGRVIYAAIESEELGEEIDSIHSILGAVGIRGLSKTEKPFVPHLTLGETENGHALSATEQKHIKHMLDEELTEVIDVQPWDVYPTDVLVQGRH